MFYSRLEQTNSEAECGARSAQLPGRPVHGGSFIIFFARFPSLLRAFSEFEHDF
jgi:hypothetical protein